MTLFQIVGLYIGLNLLLTLILMLRVGQVRIKEKVLLGDGENPHLFARIRAHANFTETAPMAMIGLFALASVGAAPLVLHLIGGLFTLGRVAHAHGMAQKNAMGKGRTIGAITAALTFLGTGLALIVLAFTG